MWTHRYATDTDLRPEQIWPVLADVPSWPSIDRNIEHIEMLDLEPGVGARFTLKPRGGPRLSFEIGEFEAPSRYADVCRLPWARMTTRHLLEPGRVTAEIEISGPLAWLWGRLVGAKHAAGLPALTERMLQAARAP